MGDDNNKITESVASSATAVKLIAASDYDRQAQRLSYDVLDKDGHRADDSAVKAEFITPQDPVVVTADGGRLPTIPIMEADNLNILKYEAERGRDGRGIGTPPIRHEALGAEGESSNPESGDGSLSRTMPPAQTNPLFPPLPLYGPASIVRNLQCLTFRVSSFFLASFCLGIVVVSAGIHTIPTIINHIWLRLTFRNPYAQRLFHAEENKRSRLRKEADKAWRKRSHRRRSVTILEDKEDEAGENDGYIPTEGGADPLVCDAAYYARRVGLDIEEVKVQTEDGFIIPLLHVYNPLEYTPMSPSERGPRGPAVFTNLPPSRRPTTASRKPKYPILLMHGLMQSAGAYCSHDDHSFAFYLCKSGYDVWLGNNRCGFNPEHTKLKYSDPRMWAWNIRQMGVMDLAALISRVLSETGFEKLGLVCHSQGTTQTFVALAKDQRPELGEKISVFCALAPAAFAGPLLGRWYFNFVRMLSPTAFRLIFGIHTFIPLMMTMHQWIPGRIYGLMGYHVFTYLFNWTDTRWDRGLRDRGFMFSPTYISSESMRWWLGRDCFAKQKCILEIEKNWKKEDEEDEMTDYYENLANQDPSDEKSQEHLKIFEASAGPKPTAWYNHQFPPIALWVAGDDDLVDGHRLLRRFKRGREPHVKVVHSKVVKGYEHLDVIWAIDAVDQVGREVRDVIWQTCNVREQVRVPRGCEDVAEWGDGGVTTEHDLRSKDKASSVS